jgi:hypothetical protein
MQEAKDVVGQYRRLAVFPLLSMLGLMLGFFVLTIPAVLALGTPGKSIMATLGNGFGLLEGKLTSKTIWFVFPLYFFEYFTVVFFNTALACSALRAFRGEDVSVMTGLRMAVKRIPTLLAWTLVASTVGLVLRLIEERADSVARFFSEILGALWSLAIVLVVPVLAAEELGPVQALRRSATLFKKTWGEDVGGSLGGMMVVGLLLLLVVLPLALLSFYLFGNNPPLLIVGLAICAIIVLALCAVVSACEMVFKTILYSFATRGPLPGDLDADALRDAFPTRIRASSAE